MLIRVKVTLPAALDAVTVNWPATPLAVNTGATALPFWSVVTGKGGVGANVPEVFTDRLNLRPHFFPQSTDLHQADYHARGRGNNRQANREIKMQIGHSFLSRLYIMPVQWTS